MQSRTRFANLSCERLERRELLATIFSGLPVVGEFPQTTWHYLTLSGTLDDAQTASVLVNGRLAERLPDGDEWSITGVDQPPQVLVPRGSDWRYLDDGSDQGTDWRARVFDDVDWLAGPAPLGYGNDDVTTHIGFGEDPQNKYATTYFRHSFELREPNDIAQLIIRLRYDDGAAVYINGLEAVRTSNLPDGASFNKFASNTTPDEDTYFDFVVPASLMSGLVVGTNTISVEVHASAPHDRDVNFDLELAAVLPDVNDVPLRLYPGINRITVEEVDAPDGTGNVLRSDFVDVWYSSPNGVTRMPGGIVNEATVLDPNGGPYHYTDDVTVAAGVRYTILPGTTLYFDEDVELLIHGILDAQGTQYERIRFTSVPNAPFVPDRPNNRAGLPDGPPRWSGIHFDDSLSPDNIIAYADIDYAQSADGSIGASNSEVVVDHVTWRGTHLRMFRASSASYEISNSVFPDMFAPEESPRAIGLDNVSEHIKTTGGIPAGGRAIIRNNVLGTNKGHNDVIDAVSGFRPNPILEIRNNVFLGSGDEGLDLGGDVYVEGNLFMNIGRDEDNRGRLYANAISTGDASGITPTVVLARNVFWNVDHVIHLRGGDAAVAENNTIVGIRDDYVDESGRTNITSAFHLFVESDSAGAGAYLADNIFWDIPRVFGNPDQPGDTTSQLELTHNLLDPRVADDPIGERPVTLRGLGTGNVIDEPGFVDATVGNFELVAGSLGKGAGRFGQDVGAFVRAGIWITDEPDLFTNDTSATMTLGGPGIFGFRYRLDGGPWSDTVTISERFNANGRTTRTAVIDLNDLSPGLHQVEAIGQDFAGRWQSAPTLSGSWSVGSAVPGDLDADGMVTAEDIELLYDAINDQTQLPYFDLNQDGDVNEADVRYLVETVLETFFGDANLDGIVDGTDFGIWRDNKFQVGRDWSNGEFNGDDVVDASDFNIWNENRFVAAASTWDNEGMIESRRHRQPHAALLIASSGLLPSRSNIADLKTDAPTTVVRTFAPQGRGQGDGLVNLTVIEASVLEVPSEFDNGCTRLRVREFTDHKTSIGKPWGDFPVSKRVALARSKTKDLARDAEADAAKDVDEVALIIEQAFADL